VTSAAELHDAVVPLAVAAGAALTLWVVVLWTAIVATRVRSPRPMPAGLELGGEESPAVANLLTNGWRLDRDAVGATLLDLAARKVLAVEPTEGAGFSIRIVDDSSPLVPYEGQLLELVRSTAGAGAVPCEALTIGAEPAATRWLAKFEESVRSEARASGLSRARWPKSFVTLMVVLSGVVAGLVAAAAGAASVSGRGEDGSSDPGGLVVFVGDRKSTRLNSSH